jgi:hypothetical protein
MREQEVLYPALFAALPNGRAMPFAYRLTYRLAAIEFLRMNLILLLR